MTRYSLIVICFQTFVSFSCLIKKKEKKDHEITKNNLWLYSIIDPLMSDVVIISLLFIIPLARSKCVCGNVPLRVQNVLRAGTSKLQLTNAWRKIPNSQPFSHPTRPSLVRFPNSQPGLYPHPSIHITLWFTGGSRDLTSSWPSWIPFLILFFFQIFWHLPPWSSLLNIVFMIFQWRWLWSKGGWIHFEKASS